MRAGVIDIGSSSIKLIIGEKQDDDIKILSSLKNVVPIGKHAFLKGRIPQVVINQIVSVLEKYKQVLQEYEITEPMVVATTAVREAQNKDIILDTIRRKTGFQIEVFNIGDVIYYIDYCLSYKLKKTYPIREKNLLIAELGAGSLDLSVLEKGLTLFNIGFPIGTLRLAQFMSQLDGSREEIYTAAQEYVEQEILSVKRINPKFDIDDVILIDETYSFYLQNILPNKKRESNFFPFRQEEAAEFLSNLTERPPNEIKNDYKIPTDAAETIAGYALILNTLFKLTPNKYINILEISLSEAILANMLFKFEISEKDNKKQQLISVANFLCRRYNMDIKHVQHVAKLSENLFQSFKELLGMEDKSLLYLLLAAYLHDIGSFINSRSHHKHSEYIINSLSLFRLTEEEINIIACIARYHRKSRPMQSHILYNSLSSEKQILVQKLSAILRVANSLDRSHKQKVKKIELKVNRAQELSLVVYTDQNFVLERANFFDKKELFEEITGNNLSLVIKSLS